MAEERSSIFRQKSLDTISSPEQLTDYLKVTRAGTWAILAAVILLLVGLFAWSMVGTLETKFSTTAYVMDNEGTLVTTDKELKAGMTVIIGEDEYTIRAVSSESKVGMGAAYFDAALQDGEYEATVITERVHPIEFLFS